MLKFITYQFSIYQFGKKIESFLKMIIQFSCKDFQESLKKEEDLCKCNGNKTLPTINLF